MNYPKRLIEVDLPIRRISAHARREKSIRHGHISTLHIWWARRPLAACRAVICAALWPDPVDVTEEDVRKAQGRGEAIQENVCPPLFRTAAIETLSQFAKKVDGSLSLHASCCAESRGRWEVLARQKLVIDPADPTHQLTLRGLLLDFIADFANWDNSTVPEYLETARKLTQAAHEALGGEPGTRPLVVDPFAGGGSIPLEALRVGADAFASDLNPVAVLLNKVVLEYIPKYGQRLADEVRKWGGWVQEQAEKELGSLYPVESAHQNPIAYIWARTVLSESPGEEITPVEIPLIRSMWLGKKTGRFRAFAWETNEAGDIITDTVEREYSDGSKRLVRQPRLKIAEPRIVSEVTKGTTAGGNATCPVTHFTTTVESVRRQLTVRRGGAGDARMLAVVSVSPNITGRIYTTPVEAQILAVQEAARTLARKEREWKAPLPLLPEGELNHLRGFFNVVLYGIKRWRDLFSPRQSMAMSSISSLTSEIHLKFDQNEAGLGHAVQTCLALATDRLADYCSSSCRWVSSGEFIGNTFGRQALPMIWDFVEINPFASMGWLGACEWVYRVIEHIVASQLAPGVVISASATSHPLPDHTVNCVLTDPPYYAAIPYADCSDFFYSWLARSLRNIEPELLQAPLTPKDDECVQLSHRAAMYRQKDGPWFERQMQSACSEMRRTTALGGIGLYVFANKETAGWEAMLAAMVGAGWVITASWPIDTERGGRLRAIDSAALASSVHLVCRPRIGDSVGDWRDVLAELPRRIHLWMPRLALEGVVGADAIFACLGPALEVFSRYGRVEKASGDIVTLKEYLEHVWAAVAKEALLLVFAGADATGFDPDARLTAIWLWTLSTGSTSADVAEDDKPDTIEDDEDAPKAAKFSGFVLEFDAARKLAQGLGAHLDQLRKVVEVKGDKARLLPLAERAKHLFGKAGPVPTAKPKKKLRQPDLPYMTPADEPIGPQTAEAVELEVGAVGQTVLDRLHQAMLLFGTGRGEALKRFLVEEGVGEDTRFWKLAQSLSALYPIGTEEKRWVDGVLGRKKGLGF